MISGGFLRKLVDTVISYVFVQPNNFQVLLQNLVKMSPGERPQDI